MTGRKRTNREPPDGDARAGRDDLARLASELADIRTLHRISTQLTGDQNAAGFYEILLDAAMDVMKADAASIQLYEPETASLKLLGWKNFDPDSAAFWDRVDARSTSTCGLALADARRVVIADIDDSEVVGDPNRQAYQRSGIRAVQSTPLQARDGRPLGMISTHWRDVHMPPERDLALFDVLARQAADLIDRMQVETALRKSEERLGLAIDLGELATWDWDIGAGKIVWSDLHYRMQGYTPGEVEPTYEAWAARVHPDDLPTAEQAMAEARDAHREYRHDFRVRHPDGSVHWMAAHGRYFYDAQGRAVRMIGAMRDVTHRKEMMAALRDSEQRLERVLESISDGLIVVGTDWSITYVNAASRQMLVSQGMNAGALLGRPFLDIYPGVAGTDTETLFRRAMADRAAAEFELFHEPWQVWHAVRIFPVREGGLSIYFHDITARKAAEQALRDSQAELQRTLDSISDVFVMIDTDWRFVHINAAGHALWQSRGLDPETAIGEDIRAVLPDIAGSDFEKEVRKTMVLRVPTLFEHYFKPWDRWFACRGYPVAGNGISLYMLDITERKVAEERLRENEDYLTRLVDSIGNRFAVFDREWRWTYLNAEAREAAAEDGHDPDGLVGRVLWDVYPALRGTPFDDHMRGAMYDRTPAAFETQHHDRWLLNNVFPVRGAGIALYGQDVTEQKRLEAALRDSEARWKALTDAMPQLVWMASQDDGGITYVNDQFVRYTGAPAEALLGAGWVPYLHPDDRDMALAEWDERRAVGRPLDLELRLRRFDGRYHWFKVRAVPTPAADTSAVRRWYGTCTDIQDTMEARFRAESADRAKSEFLANMSHEIRTPLNAIVGLSSIMLRFDTDPGRQQEYLTTMNESAASLTQLIGDVLDYARIDADMAELHESDFDLPSLVDEVERMMALRAAEKGLKLHVHAASGVRRFIGDAPRIKQIVVNLVANAVKFTEAGHVEVRVQAAPLGDGRYDVAVTVTDTGIGIAPDKLEHIFGKFTQADSSITRRFGGTGLGLAISRRLAETMGGTVAVESAPAEGSVFTLRLPLRAAATPAPAAPRKTADTRAKTRRVLVVEDNPTNAMVAGTMLRGLGYPYEIASGGHQAIDAWKNGRFDIILMDVQMPDMDGLVVTRRIRQMEKARADAAVRIIAMTAHALDGDRADCMAAGMDDFIAKPFTADGLAEKLEMDPDSAA
jgi:PAS domain S-box-containing protein